MVNVADLQRCFLPCKGTNFSANHNIGVVRRFLIVVVSYPAKVQIFQLITTQTGHDSEYGGVVSYPAKVQIFQLITTIVRRRYL